MASDHGGHREILEKNCMGVLIDPDDTGAFHFNRSASMINLSRKSMLQANATLKNSVNQN